MKEFEVKIPRGIKLVRIALILVAMVCWVGGLLLDVIGLYMSVFILAIALIIPQKHYLEEVSVSQTQELKIPQQQKEQMIEVLNKPKDTNANEIELEILKKQLEQLKQTQAQPQQDLPPELPRQKPRITCTFCDQEFQNKRQRNMHMLSKHENELENQ